MLVDFRGFDTFGEIVVLGIVALTIYALLRRFRPARETMDLPEQQRFVPGDLQTDLLNPRNAHDTAIGYLMVPAVLVRLLLPFATMVAVYLFCAGTTSPVGGLSLAWCFPWPCCCNTSSRARNRVEAHLPLFHAAGLGWLAAGGGHRIGLYCCWATPSSPATSFHWTLPVVGEVHLASATFFDLGVFALVVGRRC